MKRARAAVIGWVGIAAALAPRAALAEDRWLGPDKRLHFGASAVLAAGGYGVAAPLTSSPVERGVLGGSFALLVGAAKEGWDATGRGDPSWKDFAWDVAGAGVGVALALAIDLAVRPRAFARRDAPLVVRW